MRRLLAPLVLGLFLIPGVAHASVLTSVANGTLTLTGDAANDQITVPPLTRSITNVVIDGGGGVDSVSAPGSDESDEITLQAVGTHVRITRDTSPVRVDLAGVETVDVDAGAGRDLVDVGDLGGTAVKRVDADAEDVHAAGTDGNDVIAATVFGEPARISGLAAELRATGRLTVFGFGGDDKLFAPDKLALAFDGGSGHDQAVVKGSAADETMRVAASGVDAIALNGVESVTATPGDGTDTVHVGDLSGSDISDVTADLGGLDSRVDTVSVLGTPGADAINLAGKAVITGLPAKVTLTTTDPGQKVVVDGGGGSDTIDASALTKDATQPFLLVGPGVDLIVGSPGRDVITGGTGNDVLLLGGGLDTATWAVGDGNDTIEGGAGTDFLQLDGSSAADTLRISPIGSRTRVNSNGETADLGGVERLDVLPGLGADNVKVDDMSGTDTDLVDLSLAAARGSQQRDGSPDTVTVDGTFGADTIDVSAFGPTVSVTGLAARTSVGFGEVASDRLIVDTKPGDDILTLNPNATQQLLFSSL